MKGIVKSAAVVGQVVNLLVGSTFVSPVTFIMLMHPYL
jgi:hypothetical protein